MAKNIDINNIEVICQDNLGGLNHLRLIPVVDIEYILNPINYPQSIGSSDAAFDFGFSDGFLSDGASAVSYMIGIGSIGLKPNARFYDIFFHNNVGGFTEAMLDSPNGISFNPTINVMIPMDRMEIVYWIEQAKNQRFIALYADANEQYKIVGTIKQPLKLMMDSSIGRTYNDKNGYSMTLTTVVKNKSFFIESIEDSFLRPPEGFDLGFDLGFYS
jgi:hypothetical protein